jgi:hypothetical protein
MDKNCSICGSTLFKIRAEDDVLTCYNGHIMFAFVGTQSFPIRV